VNLIILITAQSEIDEAVEYYNHQLPGLGILFFQEVDAAIERILLLPNAWTKIGNKTRRCLIKGYPYALHYIVESDNVVVTA
jgi:hypothetical protein